MQISIPKIETKIWMPEFNSPLQVSLGYLTGSGLGSRGGGVAWPIWKTGWLSGGEVQLAGRVGRKHSARGEQGRFLGGLREISHAGGVIHIGVKGRQEDDAHQANRRRGQQGEPP